MASPYLRRTIEPVLLRAAGQFPALLLTGPRQSGKTTVLRRLFGRSHRYVSLDAPDVRAAAAADPRAFLDRLDGPAVLDEIQHAPDLLSYIKSHIDADRRARGRFILTGSESFALSARIAESLAGRVGVFSLLPLSWSEARRAPHRAFPWERSAAPGRPPAPREAPLWPGIVRGLYPEPVVEPRRSASLWHASYVKTYVERDVRQLRQVGDLASFQAFLHALAARSGQLLNMADLSRDLGVALNTVKAWLGVLEASWLVYVLRPWFQNTSKRLVKTPKVYLLDPGLLCYLTGFRDATQASRGPMAGPIFESLVIGEVVKRFTHRGVEPRLHFWRTATGHEVDCIIDTGRQLVPIEVKATSTPRPGMAAGLQAFAREMGPSVAPGLVVHAGDVTLPLGGGTMAVPFRQL